MQLLVVHNNDPAAISPHWLINLERRYEGWRAVTGEKVTFIHMFSFIWVYNIFCYCPRVWCNMGHTIIPMVSIHSPIRGLGGFFQIWQTWLRNRHVGISSYGGCSPHGSQLLIHYPTPTLGLHGLRRSQHSLDARFGSVTGLIYGPEHWILL